MTIEQEMERNSKYRERIDELLCIGTDDGYRAICKLCKEEDYRYLLVRNKELLLFSKIMSIWEKERASGHTTDESIIGRTAALCAVKLEDVTVRQLIDVYNIAKFAIFRIEDGLPEDRQIEGVARVLLLGLTPELVIITAREELENEDGILDIFARLTELPTMCEESTQAGYMAAALRAYLDWKGKQRTDNTKRGSDEA